jgi:VanZ family protein
VRITSRAAVRYWVPVIVMIGLIAFESTDLFSSTHTGGFLKTLLRAIGVPLAHLEQINHLARKTGHCVGYGVLGFLIFRAFRGTYRFFAQGYEGWISSRVTPGTEANVFSVLWQPYWAFGALLGTFIVAACDEMHQKTIPSRTGTWWDVLLDTSAAFVVQIMIYLADRAKAERILRRRAK